MPEISRFFGIVIAMYYNEHNPPHFHVRYNEYEAQFDMLEGAFFYASPCGWAHFFPFLRKWPEEIVP